MESTLGATSSDWLESLCAVDSQGGTTAQKQFNQLCELGRTEVLVVPGLTRSGEVHRSSRHACSNGEYMCM